MPVFLSDEKIQMCNMSVLNHNKDNSNYNISDELSPTIGEYTTDITTGNLKALWWEFELGAHTTIYKYKQVISHVFSILDNSLDIVSSKLHINEQKNNGVAKLIHFETTSI